MKTTVSDPLEAPQNGVKVEREKLVADVRQWMRKHCPADGVDALLTRPIKASMMGLELLRDRGANVDAAIDRLNEWLVENADLVQRVNAICNVAMNARKRGELKPHRASSPASKAAATRRGAKGRELAPPKTARRPAARAVAQ